MQQSDAKLRKNGYLQPMKPPPFPLSLRRVRHGRSGNRPGWLLLGLVLLWLGCAAGAWGDENPSPGTPDIRTQPQSVNATPGSQVTFSLVANSTFAMTYQWRFLGKDIPYATQSSLTLANVDASLAGAYSVEVRNFAGPTVSDNAILRIHTTRQLLSLQPIEIPEFGPAEPPASPLVVTNLPGFVDEVTVKVFGFSHASPDDADILLVGPRDTAVYLMADAGGDDGVSNALLTFRDAAPAPVPDAGPFGTGSYQPANYLPNDEGPTNGTGWQMSANLGVFTNLDANGRWNLRVTDDTPEHGGRISGGWGLELTLALPETNVFMVNLCGTNVTPASSSSASGFGLVRLGVDGSVSYSIEINDLSSEFMEADIHGPAGSGTNAPNLFRVDYYPHTVQSGTCAGSLAAYLGSQLWQLRQGLQYLDVRTANFPAGEIRGQIVPLPLPKIIDPPRPQSVHLGHAATFQVAATSPAPLTYQWRFNRQAIPNGTNATLTLANVLQTNDGFYDVVVSNAAGSAVSVVAKLTVQPIDLMPIALGTQGTQLLDNYGPLEQGHNTPCGWTGTSARWLGLLPETEGHLIVDTLGSSIDTILTVYTGADQNQVQYVDCDVGGAGGGQSYWDTVATGNPTSIVLEVDGQNGLQGSLNVNWRFGWDPTILDQPTNLTLLAGSPAQFNVQASGVPEPQYQWHFNGEIIPGATETNYTIDAALPERAGRYEVMVSNFMGTVMSSPAELVVLEPSVLTVPVFAEGAWHLHVTGAPLVKVVLEGSPDLKHWTPVATNQVTTGGVDFVDPVTDQEPHRFYRAWTF